MRAEEIQTAYEKNTGHVIVETFYEKNPLHIPGVLVMNHGPFAWGTEADNAVHNAVVMEEIAKIAYRTFALAPGIQQ
jgi:L-ribulose-5-phosphate 4-epimerase